MIHSSGRVSGNIRYGEVEITRGGVITGQIDVLPASGAPAAGTPSETTNGEATAGESAALLS